MLIFVNKEKSTNFVVDNEENQIRFVSHSGLNTLRKFEKHFGGLEYLYLPDIDAVNRFRKGIKKTPLTNVSYKDTKKFILDNFPECFL